MFRIDKKLVAYSAAGAAKDVYTNVGDSSGEKKREEEAKKLKEAREEARRQTDEAKAEAGKILSDAKAQAKKLTEAARADAGAVLEKAKQEGYAEGTRRAERERAEQSRRETAQICALLENIGRERGAAIDAVEEGVVGLVLEISKKVINVQLEKDDKTVVEIVRNALGKMKRQGRIEIRVGPEDYRRLFSAGIAEFVIDDEMVRAAVTEEPHFGRGDCVLESDGETINAGIDSQLRSIALAFRSRAKDGDEDSEL